MPLDSYSNRPIRVDLPSSTLPAVRNRSRSRCSPAVLKNTPPFSSVPSSLLGRDQLLGFLAQSAGRTSVPRLYPGQSLPRTEWHPYNRYSQAISSGTRHAVAFLQVTDRSDGLEE